MADQTDNLADSFFTLHYSADKGATFTKFPHLQMCDPVDEKKTKDEVTSTDDRRTIMATVDFKEGSEIAFEYVYNESSADHQAIEKAYEDSTDLVWQIKYPDAPSLNRQFSGEISELEIDASDKKKKLRRKGVIVLTGDTSKELGPVTNI